MPSYLDRYLAGEHEQVWSELLRLGLKVRKPEYFADAWKVACETMTRVRKNLTIIQGRLKKAGYKFACKHPLVPPDDVTDDNLELCAGMIGELPLSLHAFFLIVGEVDFCQNFKQIYLESRDARDGKKVPEIRMLGHYDPLVVYGIDSVLALDDEEHEGRFLFGFAPDPIFKAGLAGGESYEFWLPNPRADVYLGGFGSPKETFVQHLRYCCESGGFRDVCEASRKRGRFTRGRPKFEIVNELSAGLYPF